MKRFFGGLLIGLGILIGGSSGLCALAFIPIAGPVVLIAVIPIGIGAALFIAGRALWRSAEVDDISHMGPPTPPQEPGA